MGEYSDFKQGLIDDVRTRLASVSDFTQLSHTELMQYAALCLLAERIASLDLELIDALELLEQQIDLETYLQNTENYQNFLILIATQSTMNAIAASQTAMDAVAASQTAMDAIATSQTAMDAIINSSLALNTVVNSQTAMDAIINSSLALNTVVNSQTAMDAIAASQTALEAMFNSAVAKDAMFNSAIAEKALRDSTIAMNYCDTIATEITINAAMNTEVEMVAGHVFCVSLKMYCNIYDYNRRARNFVHFQDGVTAATMTEPNNETDQENWPLCAGRMFDGLYTIANTDRAMEYNRIARVIYM